MRNKKQKKHLDKKTTRNMKLYQINDKIEQQKKKIQIKSKEMMKNQKNEKN